MLVKLLNPEEVKYFPVYVGYMAAVCYDSYDYLRDNSFKDVLHDEEKVEKLAKIGWHCIRSGHNSPSRGFTFKFYVEGISRVCANQLVRHSIGFYPNQRSQRYVTENINYIIPPTINNSHLKNKYCYILSMIIWDFYKEMIEEGIPVEDARYILPNACHTSLTLALTWEALINFMHQRLCNKAQWEIRELANKMKKSIEVYLPELKDFLVPKCKYLGKCPEEKRCNK
jgi:thymidylate synthase (FAD)